MKLDHTTIAGIALLAVALVPWSKIELPALGDSEQSQAVDQLAVVREVLAMAADSVADNGELNSSDRLLDYWKKACLQAVGGELTGDANELAKEVHNALIAKLEIGETSRWLDGEDRQAAAHVFESFLDE